MALEAGFNRLPTIGPKNDADVSVTITVTQYADITPLTLGGLPRSANTCTAWVPLVVKPLAAAIMQALSILVRAVPGGVAGQMKGAPEEQPS